MRCVESKIAELEVMEKYPDRLFYKGRLELLKRPKVAIIGSRKCSQYAKRCAFQIANELAKRGVCIVSGAAMGIDAHAHRGAGAENTIAVMANGLDLRYPKINASLIESIEKEGLTLSRFEPGFKATRWSFPVRNEIITALGEAVIIAQADENSGSMRSAEHALRQGKKLYVLPHRLGESGGSNALAAEGKAEVIYDLHGFCDRFGKVAKNADEVLEFCKSAKPLEEVLQRFGEKIYEYELEGKVHIENAKVQTL